ncbi:unnamed protein product [Oppiella nova]|uniref:Innexin n=1 Tax=Oppiella nova TaxID=334625 RepID=A0A7R9LJV6_9ACAR|nr:unnamed protein product [Oppiella nova]CAG2164365.1 unnamed protein product [Oppiella nova]
MVLALFQPVKKLVKKETVYIDNNTFRLHYRATVILLIAFSIVITSGQYFGDPIDCISKDFQRVDKHPFDMLDTYCWIHSTFVLPDAMNKKVGVEVAHPGVDKHTPDQKQVYHSYYQWVGFVLFLQAVMFYAPRYIWKNYEDGKLKVLVQGLGNPIIKDGERGEKIQALTKYLKANLRYHNAYFWYYTACELANMANVIIQMYLVDSFLGGAFSTYGSDVLNHSESDQENRVDPMIQVFPRMTKCTFRQYGSSGDVQKHDALCILPLNIVNEKIYIILWFWFIILAVITGITIVYRLLIIFFPALRYLTLRSQARLTDANHLRLVMEVSKIGDWFLLSLLCRNIDGQHYRELIQEFSKAITEDGSGEAMLENSEKQALTSSA